MSHANLQKGTQEEFIKKLNKNFFPFSPHQGALNLTDKDSTNPQIHQDE